MAAFVRAGWLARVIALREVGNRLARLSGGTTC